VPRFALVTRYVHPEAAQFAERLPANFLNDQTPETYKKSRNVCVSFET
jgi:hypothetical protein